MLGSTVGVLLMMVTVSTADEDNRPRLVCKHQACQYLSTYTYSEFLVDGEKTYIDTEQETFDVYCFGSVLDSPALPTADPALQIKLLKTKHCPLPAHRSISEMLKAFNVTLLREENKSPRIELLYIPGTQPLNASLLIGVEDIVSFIVQVKYTERGNANPGFLAPLKNSNTLLELSLKNIEIHNGDLDLLPLSLKQITLVNVNVEQLPELLTSSPKLQYLAVESTVALSLHSVGPALKELKLSSPATSVNVTSVPLLRNLVLTGWTEEKPNALASCDKLKTVIMLASAVTALPDGWLAHCSQLFHLELQGAQNLTTLPDKLLLNANALRSLLITGAALETLPNGLLRHSPILRTLNLSGNRLLTLSSTMYLPFTLTNINLASNNLDSNAVDALASPWSLEYLDLSHNPRLGDLCKETGYSAIHKATDLLELTLRGTSVSRICIDWRLNMTQLRWLDLSNTDITKLSNEDLQFNRSEFAQILLKGAPLNVVEIKRDYYEQLKEKNVLISRHVVVRINATLPCNCQMYWTWLAQELGALDHVNNLYCSDKLLLSDVAADDLVCDAETECADFEQLPASCACHWRPDTEAPGGVVHVNCSHSGLQHFPHLHASVTPPRHYHLLLADNNITQLHATDLNGNITVLDLRNNSIERADSDTAEQIARGINQLRLAGNPLQCDCRAAPLLTALHRRNSRTGSDISNVTCHDGRPLLSVPVEECATLTPVPHSNSGYALAGGLAALLVIVIAVGVTLGSRSRRFFLRAVLHRWGCLWRASEPETDDSRPYDAFITFSHEDEAVAIQLVRRLEPTYRLCVHYRDWTPGRLIAEQITESVETSRRTVALVSRNFINSAWARAEFRSAHSEALRDTSHRLIVVLLENPEALPLDDQLKSYLKTNTYVCWEDPWFWDKLQVALPPVRPTPASQHISLRDIHAQSLPSP